MVRSCVFVITSCIFAADAGRGDARRLVQLVPEYKDVNISDVATVAVPKSELLETAGHERQRVDDDEADDSPPKSTSHSDADVNSGSDSEPKSAWKDLVARPLDVAVPEAAEDAEDVAINREMDCFDDELSVTGTLLRVDQNVENATKGGRRWWVVRFRDDFVVMIKMWNGELDVKKNQPGRLVVGSQRRDRWKQDSRPHTTLGKLPAAIRGCAKEARYRLVNTNMARVAHNTSAISSALSLKFNVVVAEEPTSRTCYTHGRKTLKRAAKGWFGIYSEKNMYLHDSNDFMFDGDKSQRSGALATLDEETGEKGAKILGVVIDLWDLMYKLENYYGLLQTRAEGEVDELLNKHHHELLYAFAAVELRVDTIECRETQGEIKSLLASWKTSIGRAGVEEVIAKEIREAPVAGAMVRLKSGTVVRVENVSRVPVTSVMQPAGPLERNGLTHEASSGEAEAEHDAFQDVESAELLVTAFEQGSAAQCRDPSPESLKTYTGKQWAELVEGPVDEDPVSGPCRGQQGERYGHRFKLVSNPYVHTEPPLEGSLWADVEHLDGNGKTEAVIRPECFDHPAIGKKFVIGKYGDIGGTYLITGVEVVEEKRKVALVLARRVNESTAAVNPRENLLDVWPRDLVKELAGKHQLRLEIDGVEGQLKIKGLHRSRILVKWKDNNVIGPVPVYMVQTSNQAHQMVVSRRVADILVLALNRVWSLDYAADDHDKLVKKRTRIAVDIVAAVMIIATAVTTAGATVVGVEALIAGTAFIDAIFAAQGSLWGFLASQIFSKGFMLSSKGMPRRMINKFGRKYQASLIARSTLDFGRVAGATALAMTLCPPGSHKLPKKTDGDIRYAMCRRHRRLRQRVLQEKVDSEKETRKELLIPDGPRQSLRERLNLKKKSEAEKRRQANEASMYLMVELARAFGAVSDMRCEVVADNALRGKYKMVEKWVLPQPERMRHEEWDQSLPAPPKELYVSVEPLEESVQVVQGTYTLWHGRTLEGYPVWTKNNSGANMLVWTDSNGRWVVADQDRPNVTNRAYFVSEKHGGAFPTKARVWAKIESGNYVRYYTLNVSNTSLAETGVFNLAGVTDKNSFASSLQLNFAIASAFVAVMLAGLVLN